MIETIELTPALVGLGDLHEAALLALFADTHYRVLTHGGTATPREIADKSGQPLYPSVVAVHLQAPAQRPIESHALWRELDVGVDVRSFGRQFLEVTAVVGRVGEVPDAVEAWGDLPVPRATWSSAWTATRPGGEHELAMPAAELLAHLPRLTQLPAGINAARDAQARGALPAMPELRGAPIRYPVVAGRDAAVGRQMMFSHFVVVMDAVEREYLGRRVAPAFPSDVLDCVSTLERRIFYFGNCGAGDVIEVRVAATLERASPARVRIAMELVDERSGRLLALAEATRNIALPPARAALVPAVERLLARHGEGRPVVEARP